MDINQKWDVVLRHYGKKPFQDVFGVVHKPKPQHIEFLFQKKLLMDEEMNHLSIQPGVNIKKFIGWDFGR